MARVAIWTGSEELAESIASAIKRWDEKGEVASRVQVKLEKDDQFSVFATFATKSDEQDAVAYADGFADGYEEGLADTESGEDEDDEEEEDDE